MKPSHYTTELVTAYGSDFLIPADDLVIGRIPERRYSETDDIGRVCEYLDQHCERISDRKLFIDIGANIGTHSISALSEHRFNHAVAIEPSEKNYRLLTANLCLHGLFERSTCIKAAASNCKTTKHLFHNLTNCGDYRLDNNPHGNDIDNSSSLELVNTLDACEALLPHMASINLSDSLCWIDTQGHEVSILDSLYPLLLAGLPTVFEFWPYGMERQGSSYKQLENILSKANVGIALINNEDIRQITLDELQILWTDLRAADTGKPDGESYCNILIYPLTIHEEINPQNRSRIEMTVRCQDSDFLPKVPNAGGIFMENGKSIS